MKTPYDEKGNASHYSEGRLQTIIKFERTYGTLAVMLFCEITAEKYRQRIGRKDDPTQELLKISWYEKAAAFYFDRLGKADEIIVDNRKKLGLPWENKPYTNCRPREKDTTTSMFIICNKCHKKNLVVKSKLSSTTLCEHCNNPLFYSIKDYNSFI